MRFRPNGSVEQHVRQILHDNPVPPPWKNISISATATAVPLLTGLLRGQPALSIFGALAGYLIALNDTQTRMRERLRVFAFTLGTLTGGFTLGYLLRGQHLAYTILLGAGVYAAGLISNEAGELERAYLFALITTVVGYSVPDHIPAAAALMILLYAVLGFFSVVMAAFLTRGIPNTGGPTSSPASTSGEPTSSTAPTPATFPGLRAQARKILEVRKSKHLYAAVYTLCALGSVAIMEHLHQERGYWTTITVLLVMKPDRTQAAYRSLQRLLGTALAVLLMHFAAIHLNQTLTLTAMAVTAAAVVPWALKRNYSWVSFLATLMVIALIELGARGHLDLHAPHLRLQATLYGCGLSLIGLVIWHLLERRR